MTQANQTSTNEINWPFWSGVVFFALVLVGLLLGGWTLFDKMMANKTAPITTVVIDGETPFTNKADIRGVVVDEMLNNFFQLDVNQVQQSLESLPWVRTASVRKHWPDKLNLYVVDHSPVAIWNEKFVINTEGELVAADLSRIGQPLPMFWGPDGKEKLALENFNSLNSLLKTNNLAIDKLELSGRHAWKLTLSSGIKLNLGREKRVERIQRFIDVYPEILSHKKANQEIDYVDLRYDTGVAVGWKEPDEKRV